MDKHQLSKALITLSQLMSKLRSPDGCPWDARQTSSTIKMYLLEEAYEVLDAIERGSPEDVCKELGDLLFQIIFLARLAEERGEFDLLEVLEKISEKMINRHPHVFGQIKVKSPEEVADNWERIKRAEKDAPETFSSLLQSLPVDLPALLKAQRLSERASKAGFDRSSAEEIWGRIEEKFEELRKSVSGRDQERIGEHMGDLLFNLVNWGRHWGFNAENLLRGANQKFIEHLSEMETELNASGIGMENATQDVMRRVLKKVKGRIG